MVEHDNVFNVDRVFAGHVAIGGPCDRRGVCDRSVIQSIARSVSKGSSLFGWGSGYTTFDDQSIVLLLGIKLLLVHRVSVWWCLVVLGGAWWCLLKVVVWRRRREEVRCHEGI